MPQFRYQAADERGVPVYGILETHSESSLRELLQRRGQRLLSFHEQSVDATMRQPSRRLPRLLQLRLGERIREAFLTELPAQEAIRAMAAEPFEHPLLVMMPLVSCMAFISILPALAWQLLMPGSDLLPRLAIVLAFVVVPAVWWLIYFQLDQRPRAVLNQLAADLEQGNISLTSVSGGIPEEVRAILQSAGDDHQKALAVSELMPLMMGSRFYLHRLLLTIVGSMAVVLLLGLAGYLVMWQMIPQFKSILEDFATELPTMTLLVVQFSDMIAWMGATGFFVCGAAAFIFLIVCYAGLSHGPMAELISGVPLLGLPFRWLMQARVARVLAVMLHYGCDRAEALRTATAASGFRSVQERGALMADEMKAGKPVTGWCSLLSGLPLTLLTMPGQQEMVNTPHDTVWGERVRQQNAGIAPGFHAIAQMLEQASQGQSRFLSMVLQLCIMIAAGFTVGFVVLAIFLPLIKLLNGLA